MQAEAKRVLAATTDSIYIYATSENNVAYRGVFTKYFCDIVKKQCHERHLGEMLYTVNRTVTELELAGSFFQLPVQQGSLFKELWLKPKPTWPTQKSWGVLCRYGSQKDGTQSKAPFIFIFIGEFSIHPNNIITIKQPQREEPFRKTKQFIRKLISKWQQILQLACQFFQCYFTNFCMFSLNSCIHKWSNVKWSIYLST